MMYNPMWRTILIYTKNAFPYICITIAMIIFVKTVHQKVTKNNSILGWIQGISWGILYVIIFPVKTFVIFPVKMFVFLAKTFAHILMLAIIPIVGIFLFLGLGITFIVNIGLSASEEGMVLYSIAFVSVICSSVVFFRTYIKSVKRHGVILGGIIGLIWGGIQTFFILSGSGAIITLASIVFILLMFGISQRADPYTGDIRVDFNTTLEVVDGKATRAWINGKCYYVDSQYNSSYGDLVRVGGRQYRLNGDSAWEED